MKIACLRKSSIVLLVWLMIYVEIFSSTLEEMFSSAKTAVVQENFAFLLQCGFFSLFLVRVRGQFSSVLLYCTVLIASAAFQYTLRNFCKTIEYSPLYWNFKFLHIKPMSNLAILCAWSRILVSAWSVFQFFSR